MKVMIAGIGGASLGTELEKCLRLAGGYEVFGCDISPTAYGLYESRFAKTFLIDREAYVSGVIAACHEAGAEWLLPGGEQPMVLLGAAEAELKAQGITLLANHPDIIRDFSDKARTFALLKEKGFPIPKTAIAETVQDIHYVGLPCIIKPATGTGGSAMVFFATDAEEAMVYTDYIRRLGSTPIAQEYIDEEGGEFTVGVLSWPDGSIAGSIALKRSLSAKLSVMTRSRGGVISSGYSQGYIADFPAIRAQAEAIAKAIGSRGPINVQGRINADGVLVPFEINPRFSASSYLRAMAGFNEPHLFLQHLAHGSRDAAFSLREGWYLRSLTEHFVAPEEVK